MNDIAPSQQARAETDDEIVTRAQQLLVRAVKMLTGHSAKIDYQRTVLRMAVTEIHNALRSLDHLTRPIPPPTGVEPNLGGPPYGSGPRRYRVKVTVKRDGVVRSYEPEWERYTDDEGKVQARRGPLVTRPALEVLDEAKIKKLERATYYDSSYTAEQAARAWSFGMSDDPESVGNYIERVELTDRLNRIVWLYGADGSTTEYTLDDESANQARGDGPDAT